MHELTEQLRQALAGSQTVVLPARPHDSVRVFPAETFDPGGTNRNAPALVVHTSGSTGAPKAVGLSAGALRASASATEKLLAGPGQWYLTLPTNHIAGVQVLLRALQAGTVPFQANGSFTAERFAADVRNIRDCAVHSSPMPLYTSLVPTQLVRILADSEATAQARSFTAILLGGAAISPALITAAEAAGLKIVRTYGMSETGGGCVYNGIPFDTVTVEVEPTSGESAAAAGEAPSGEPPAGATKFDPAASEAPRGAAATHSAPPGEAQRAPDTSPLGRVRLTGPVLADGYVRVHSDHLSALTDTEQPGFSVTDSGQRSFLTSDLGRLTDGVLSIAGRADDVFISGGINVSPLAVENTLLEVLEPFGAAEVLLTSLPDDTWGERGVLLVRPQAQGLRLPGTAAAHTGRAAASEDSNLTAAPGDEAGSRPAPGLSRDLTAQVRELVHAAGRRDARLALEPAQVPGTVLLVDEIPARSIGKPDRAAARTLAEKLTA